MKIFNLIHPKVGLDYTRIILLIMNQDTSTLSNIDKNFSPLCIIGTERLNIW